MGTRFGRRASDGTFEYHDSKESLIEASRRDNSEDRAGLFGLVGLVLGGVLAYVALNKLGIDGPKWLRFGCVVTGAGASAYLLAKFADLLWTLIVSLMALLLLGWLAQMIWRVI